MGIIKAVSLIHDYVTRDDEDNEVIVRAIDGVDLEVESGDFIAILGHNGSGKSSLAKHINALLLPTEGSIVVDGMDTRQTDDKLSIRQKAGMVFQNPDNQLVSSVVEEDVAFGPENLGVPTDEIWTRVNNALNAVNITKLRYKSPDKLSGGQKQRVAIAGVMAMELKCIILDEPTAMLDPIGRKEVIDSVHQLNKEKGITVILITHFMEEAVDADKVIVMNKGKLVLQGSPKEVFEHVEEMKNWGLEVPQVTELVHNLKNNGINIDCDFTRPKEFVDKIVQRYYDM